MNRQMKWKMRILMGVTTLFGAVIMLIRMKMTRNNKTDSQTKIAWQLTRMTKMALLSTHYQASKKLMRRIILHREALKKCEETS